MENPISNPRHTLKLSSNVSTSQRSMAGANIFLIFNRPSIPRSLYERFNDEFRDLMDETQYKMETAWEEFTENTMLPRYERMSAIETCFLTSLLDWQDLSSRAQQEIGSGHSINFEDVYVQFGIGDVEMITTQQLRNVEAEMMSLIEIVREIMIHAATRIVEDPEPVV